MKKNLLVFLAFFVLSLNVSALWCQNVWDISPQDSDALENDLDQGRSIDTTQDGGYIIAADSQAYSAIGAFNIWLIKTDGAGNTCNYQAGSGNCSSGSTFAKMIGVNVGDSEYAFEIQKTVNAAGTQTGYVIAGRTGPGQAWVVKTDNSGNTCPFTTVGNYRGDCASGRSVTQFASALGANNGNLDEAYSVQQTFDVSGNPTGYIMAGRTRSYPAGQDNAWVVKLDTTGLTCAYAATGNCSNGVVSFSRVLGAATDDYFRSVKQTFDAAGNPTGYIMAGFTGVANTDMWLVKIDTAGNIQWGRNFGGAGGDEGYSVVQAVDAGGVPTGYIITGSTNSYGGGTSEAWVIKTDSTGLTCDYTGNGNCAGTLGTEKVFAKTIGQPGINDSSRSVIQYFAVPGEVAYVVTGLSFQSPSRIILAKLDENGTTQFTRYIARTSNPNIIQNNGYDLVEATDGGLGIVGMQTFSGLLNYDIWLVKTDEFGNWIDYCLDACGNGMPDDPYYTSDDVEHMGPEICDDEGDGVFTDAPNDMTDDGACIIDFGNYSCGSPGFSSLCECRLNECGDSYLYSGFETCDSGGPGDLPGDAIDDGQCIIDFGVLDCELNTCGDGYLWSSASGGTELCDDGTIGDLPGDAIVDGDCVIDNVNGLLCEPNVCGDTYLGGSEECDDGAFGDLPGDAVADGACVMDLGVQECLLNVCGDGYFDSSTEECDDGNLDPCDACDNTCDVAPLCQPRIVDFYINPVVLNVGEDPDEFIGKIASNIAGNFNLKLRLFNPEDQTTLFDQNKSVPITIPAINTFDLETEFPVTGPITSSASGSYAGELTIYDDTKIYDTKKVFFTIIGSQTVSAPDVPPLLAAVIAVFVLVVISGRKKK